MKISTINQGSNVLAAKSNYQSEKTAGVVEPKPRFDIVELSKQLQGQKKREGLFNDAVAPPPEEGKFVLKGLLIRNVDVNAPSSSSCEENARRGNVDDFFFHVNGDFIKQSAEQIYKDGEFNPYAYDRELEALRTATLDWFLGDAKTSADIKQMDNSLKALSEELANRMKNGGDTGLESLTTKVVIGKESVSISELLSMQKTAKSIYGDMTAVYGLSTVTGGSDSYIALAQKGIVKAAVNQYSQTLSGELGKGFRKAFNTLLDNSANACNYSWKNGIKSYDDFIPQSIKDWTVETASECYKLFSDIDFSSAETARADFQDKLNSFDKMLSSSEWDWSSYNKSYKAQLSEVFNGVLNKLF